MRPHVRIEQPPRDEPGTVSVVRNDRIFAVDADGNEADFSHAVAEWRVISKAGEARRLVIEIYGFAVEDPNAYTRTRAADEPEGGQAA